MKFTRKCVVIMTNDHEGSRPIAYFNNINDAKDYLLDCRKKRRYDTYRMYQEVEVNEESSMS